MEALYFGYSVVIEPKDGEVVVLADGFGHYFQESFELQIHFLIEFRGGEEPLLFHIIFERPCSHQWIFAVIQIDMLMFSLQHQAIQIIINQ